MNLKFTLNKNIATLVFNRPEKRNAINKAICKELIEVVEKINVDSKIKVVVLTGAGEEAFSSGADMSEIKSRTPFEKRNQVREEAPSILRKCSKPIIAMLKGYVLGGGLEVALTSDMRMAAENVIMGFPEITRGWIPANGGTQLLPRLIGEGAAMRLILSGEFINAKEALNMGLVDAVYPLEEIEDKVYELAEKIANKRLEALLLGKSSIKMASRTNLDIGLEYEKELITLCYTFPDRESGYKDFIKKD